MPHVAVEADILYTSILSLLSSGWPLMQDIYLGPPNVPLISKHLVDEWFVQEFGTILRLRFKSRNYLELTP